MNYFSEEGRAKIREIFEKAGLLFPKSRPTGGDRRSGSDRRSVEAAEYLADGGVERRDHLEMRQNPERRSVNPKQSPLSGML